MAARPKTPPLILSGGPRAVRGRITIENTGSDRLVIRGGVLHLRGRQPIDVQLTAIVAPGATIEEVVSVDLGPATPAGVTLGHLEVGGQRRDVEVQVVQAIALDLSPREILATGTDEVTLVVRNLGNVPIPLARMTRGTLRPHDADPSAQGPDAQLRLPRAQTIEPGGEASIAAQVDIPKGLDAARRHHARLPVGPTDLLVTVLPSDPPAARPKPRKRSTTTKES